MDLEYIVNLIKEAGGAKWCGGIYAIRNTVTGKAYVGGAVKLRSRLQTHLRQLRRGCHHSLKLQRSWNKHGEEAFKIEILELVDVPEKVVPRENLWLERLKPYRRHGGYNICKQGRSRLGVKASPETRAKMSASQRGRKLSPEHVEKIRKRVTGFRHTKKTRAKIGVASTGRLHTEEAKVKIGAAHRGKVVSEETRRKISEINKGNQTWLGRTHTEESKRRMSESRKGQRFTPKQLERVREANQRTHKGKVVSKETRRRISEAKKGHVVSEETRRKLREAWVRRKKRNQGA